MEHVKVTVYDVADKILPMFDDRLSKYAQERASRQGTSIKTGHSIRELKRGFPKVAGAGGVDYHDDVKASGYTLHLKNGEDSEVGCGLVVWSTGLMANPFLEKSFSMPFTMPSSRVKMVSDAKADATSSDATTWMVHRHSRSGSIMTDDFLRVQLLAAGSELRAPTSILRDVYALGDCATVDGAAHPATAQVASQKAKWLARKLNSGDAGDRGFSFVSFADVLGHNRQADCNRRKAKASWPILERPVRSYS